MSTVGTTTFLEDGNRNYITLNPPCEQYIRQMIYRGTWVTAYLGVLYSIQSTSTFNGGLWIGLGSSANGVGVGIKNGVGAIKRMLGVGSSQWGSIMGYGAGYNTMTYSNIDISGSSFINQGIFAGAISASAFQSVTGVGPGNILVPTTESPNRKGIQIAKFTRSGLTITIRPKCMTSNIYTGSNGTNHNFTDNTLFTAMGGNDPYVDGNLMYDGNHTDLVSSATDDASYPLDTINVCWTGSVPVRIYQIAMQIERSY